MIYFLGRFVNFSSFPAMFCSQACIAEYSRLCKKFSVPEEIGIDSFQILDLSGGGGHQYSILAEASKTSIFDYDFRELKNQETKRNILRCLNSFHPKSVEQDDEFRETGEMNDDIKNLERFCRIFHRNKISLVLKEENTGFTILLFGSLLNHSCDPNVNLVEIDGKFFTVVCQPIEAGDQLFVSYT